MYPYTSDNGSLSHLHTKWQHFIWKGLHFLIPLTGSLICCHQHKQAVSVWKVQCLVTMTKHNTETAVSFLSAPVQFLKITSSTIYQKRQLTKIKPKITFKSQGYFFFFFFPFGISMSILLLLSLMLRNKLTGQEHMH